MINNSQIKIIETIFNEPGINLRGVIESTRLSPNYVSKYVNSLVERGILTEKKLERKRIYLRRFFLNLKSNSARNFFKMIKEEKREDFFNNYPKLKKALMPMAEEIKGLDFLIIYGSYARFTARKDSDIDILIVGRIKDKDKIREGLVSLDSEVSIKIETLSSFRKREKDALHAQIIKEGIVILGIDKFVEIISEGEKRGL